MNDSGSLASEFDHEWNYDLAAVREIRERGLDHVRNEYLKVWRQKMRAALQVSPVSGIYVR